MLEDPDGWMSTKSFVLLARALQLDVMLLEQMEEDTTYGTATYDAININ